MSTPTLQQHYKEKVVPALTKKLGYTNPHQVPALEKIVVTSCMGKEADRKVAVDDAVLPDAAAPAAVRPRKSKSQQRREERARIAAERRGEVLAHGVDIVLSICDELILAREQPLGKIRDRQLKTSSEYGGRRRGKNERGGSRQWRRTHGFSNCDSDLAKRRVMLSTACLVPYCRTAS